jgi:hypothetical protein
MKKNEPLGRYPYRCPDCPELHPFKSRVKYARHRAARHSTSDVEEMIYDPNPAPLALDLTDFKFGHGTGALPTLDRYDERAR